MHLNAVFFYFMFEQCSFPYKTFKGTVHPLVKKYLLFSLVVLNPLGDTLSSVENCSLKSRAAAGRICRSTDDANQVLINDSEKIVWI